MLSVQSRTLFFFCGVGAVAASAWLEVSCWKCCTCGELEWCSLWRFVLRVCEAEKSAIANFGLFFLAKS